MRLILDILTVTGLLFDGIGALIIVTPDSEYLDNSIGRIFSRTRRGYNEFLRLEHEHYISIEDDEDSLPAFLVSVFDLECEPSDINQITKDGLGEDANLDIFWEGESSSGSYTTSYERAKDMVESARQRRYLRRGAGLLVVGFGLQIAATLL